MPNIIDMDTHKTINVISFVTQGGNTHLVPESTIRAIIRGELSITALDGWREIVNVMFQAELKD